MFLIVGLGNPGEEYEHTRHNAGFDSLDLVAEEAGARYWKTECGALTAKGVWRDHDVVLAKPQSYMNTSGGPVKQLMNAYNGLRSICDKLGTRDWFRVRCGIGRPPGRMPVVDWVLGRPKKEQADDFAQATHLASQAALGLVTDGLEKTQQRFN